MNTTKRKWQEYSNEEKLLVIQSYLDGMRTLDGVDNETQNARLQWLREHLPAYNLSDNKNYVFVSYSHRDFAKVYHDLAVFLYNSDTKVRFWYDEGLPAGENWADAAKKYIENPHCVGAIFYLSENLLSSDAVLQEIDMIGSSGKPYVAIALDKDKFSASRILQGKETSPTYQKLNDFFPDADTALVYGEDYENILYRIEKIKETYNVTEDVLSDFVCEDYEDGVRLIAYEGNKLDVYIPEKINDKPVVAIKAEFLGAENIFIPKTVRQIDLPDIPKDEYIDIQDENTATMFRLVEFMIGGYQKTRTIFGKASNLASIHVDDNNPYFYDKYGCLYDRKGTLLRVPPCAEVEVNILEGVKKIGAGAFVGCSVTSDEFALSETVEELGDGAFAECNVCLMPAELNVKKIGKNVFSDADMQFPIVDISGEYDRIDEFAFRCTAHLDIVSTPYCVTRIERGAFFSSSVTLVSLDGPVQYIGDGAFALCGRLDYIGLGDSVEYIGDRAFSGCDKMLEIKIPASVRFIGDGAFENCDSLKYVYFQGTRKQFSQIKTRGEGPSSAFLQAVVCQDEKWRRFKTWWKRKMRTFAEKLLEKV